MSTRSATTAPSTAPRRRGSRPSRPGFPSSLPASSRSRGRGSSTPGSSATVKLVEKSTSGTRDQVLVVTMDKVMKPHPKRPMKKAVYCTCRDGDVVVEDDEQGGLSVL